MFDRFTERRTISPNLKSMPCTRMNCTCSSIHGKSSYAMLTWVIGSRAAHVLGQVGTVSAKGNDHWEASAETTALMPWGDALHVK
jgi:hypothetical protein